MQSYNPAITGYNFSKLLNGHKARKHAKILAYNVFCWLMLLYTHLLLLLHASVLWLSIAVTFNNDAKLPPKWILREFSIVNPTPARRVTPPWDVYMAKFDPGWEGYPVWQTGLPLLAGHSTYHVKVVKLKREIVWTGGLPHLSGLPHLPGVPHFHVNRPLGPVQTLLHLCAEPN